MDFRKNYHFVKIRPVGSELSHKDGRTDGRQTERRAEITKLRVFFRNFANAPKNK